LFILVDLLTPNHALVFANANFAFALPWYSIVAYSLIPWLEIRKSPDLGNHMFARNNGFWRDFIETIIFHQFLETILWMGYPRSHDFGRDSLTPATENAKGIFRFG
jgi:hypothetical protein